MKRPIPFALIAIAMLCGNRGVAADGPIRDGMLLWLDAQHLASARSEDPAPAQPIALWPDRSASGRDFVQSEETKQPNLINVQADAVVRFDGETDLLRCSGRPLSVGSLTLFIVAAAHENFGDYRGLFGANSPGRLDYQSGFNVDLGPQASSLVDSINVEGLGFGGARDLYGGQTAFGHLQLITVTVDAAQRSVTLRVDGKPVGQRPFDPQQLSLDELTVGARYLFHDANREQLRCAFKGDIAEVILYDHALVEPAVAAIESYLAAKHERLGKALPGEIQAISKGIELVKAVDPPPVQMLFDGFVVREIPIELTNINNVRFRSDGKLVTLGYNGDVHLLSDTDGDGLEDNAKLFWKNEGNLRGPIGMILTPANYPHGAGIITPSKGKLSLIVDQDGDDRADKEIVIASGWNEIPQNVDATGVAMADDGSLYFGLGTADYSNAYQVDSSGESRYRLDSDRGTVQKLSPDFSKRETVCTGIRFPIAFAFNSKGDLFCSEQEGATWLANGNPFDELLHIQRDRHYGFPPRHPKYNPGVIDEPSTFDYAPQHQSTCGMIFNQAVAGGPVFGPTHWADDAIVCGESRGKLWRTKLVSTPHGYVASTQLIACLQMLTVDACVAPDGDLVVACHSGPPDWGTGPTGIGKLFRIKMTRPEAARPVATWANSEREIHIAFDRPLDPLRLQGIGENVRIESGRYVRAGDRFENLSPPYAVVKRQSVAPRYAVDVHGVSVTQDLRTIVIATSPMNQDDFYSVSLPALEEVDASGDPRLERQPAVDVDFALHGIKASWQGADGTDTWRGWLPHFDWQVSDMLTQHSASHDSLRTQISGPGTLTLQTQLDLSDVLRPKVQAGSSLDFELPAESVSYAIRSTSAFELECQGIAVPVAMADDGRHEVIVQLPGGDLSRVPVTVRMHRSRIGQTPNAEPMPDWTIAIRTAEDDRWRPVPLNRFRLPWVRSTQNADPASSNLHIAELEGGNWGRGRRVFHSAAAACFKCHALHGIGQQVGPDLGHLQQRDYDSVIRDIQNPSYAINPDYIGQVVLTTDGRVLTGVIRSDQGRLLIGDSNGNVTTIEPRDVDTIKPAEVSIMPQGLHEKLTADELRDLMTFLMTPAPQMPIEGKLDAPPVRSPAEVAAVLAGSVPMTSPVRPLSIVLVAGNKDHGPGEHDYPAWQVRWSQLMTAAENVAIDNAWDFPNDDQLSSADVLIFFQKGAWDDHRQQAMDRYFARGGGAVYIHWAVNGNDRVDDFSKRIGLASRGGSISYRHGPLELGVHNTDHPIMRNIEPMSLYDESYWMLTGDPMNVTLLASSVEDGAARPQVWAYEKDAGRVFVSIPGHYNWTFDDPIFRAMLLRGIAWTAKEPVDRFNELVPLGARMSGNPK